MTLPLPKPEHKRLPRYKRAPSQVPFVLTQRDVEVLKTVKDHRLATSAHLQALHEGSNQGILRRLQKLYHGGYLDRLSPRPRYGEGSQKMVYAATNKGMKTLAMEGLIEEAASTDLNQANRSLHDYSVSHTLLISTIRTVVTLACRHLGMEMASWREGRSIQDRIEVAFPEGYRTLPVAPDAFFGMRSAKGRSFYMLEADRGSMTIKRFLFKVKAYAAFRAADRQREKFGIKYFRVLTVTKSAARCNNLVASAAREDMGEEMNRRFLFTDEGRLALSEPEGFFGPIWSRPGGAEPEPLLGGAV